MPERILIVEDEPKLAGLLRVRRKAVDGLAFVLLGTGIVLVFLSLPPRP